MERRHSCAVIGASKFFCIHMYIPKAYSYGIYFDVTSSVRTCERQMKQICATKDSLVTKIYFPPLVSKAGWLEMAELILAEIRRYIFSHPMASRGNAK